MRPMTRDRVMFLCLCLFVLSAAISALNEETAILLLIASSGTFILMGVVDDSKKERLVDLNSGRSLSQNSVDGLGERREH